MNPIDIPTDLTAEAYASALLMYTPYTDPELFDIAKNQLLGTYDAAGLYAELVRQTTVPDDRPDLASLLEELNGRTATLGVPVVYHGGLVCVAPTRQRAAELARSFDGLPVLTEECSTNLGHVIMRFYPSTR